VVRRVADLQKIYLDTEHFSANGLAPYAAMCGESWFLVPAEADPPLHGLLRAAVNPLFTPKRMALLEDRIRAYARESIAKFRARGRCELVSEFSFQFPIQIFLEMMGLPQERMAEFLKWEHEICQGVDPAKIAQATKEITGYLADVCEDRRKNPGEDLLTYGVQAEVEGRKLTSDELTGFCFNLFLGGLDTVSANIGSQFRHLAERPDHQAYLRANPDQIPTAIDELMRAYPSSTTSRRCTKAYRIGEVVMLPGDHVMLCTPLAGRDPEAFPNPNEIILDRKPRHLSFGYGPHLCIGMHLARREMRIAMEEFLALVPEFSLEPGAEIRSYAGWLVQPIEVPLVWQV
jgi:cytochrome P450